MSGSGELETLVQQALAREKEQGTGAVVTRGHSCQTPTGQYNQELAAGAIWKCVCGRKFTKQPERMYSNWNGTFVGLDRNKLAWQETGVRKLARLSSPHPLAQAVAIILALLTLLLLPVTLGVLVDIGWLHLFWLTGIVYVGGSVYLWGGRGAKRWRNG